MSNYYDDEVRPAGPAEKDLRDAEAKMRDRYGGELPPPGSEDRERWDELVEGAKNVDERDAEDHKVAARAEQTVQRLASKYRTSSGELRDLIAHGMSVDEVEERLVDWRQETPVTSLKRISDAPFEELDKSYRVDAQQASLRRHVPVPADTMGRFSPSRMSDEEFAKLDEREGKRARRDMRRRQLRR